MVSNKSCMFVTHSVFFSESFLSVMCSSFCCLSLAKTSLCDNQVSGCDVRYLELILCDSSQNLRTFLLPQHLAVSLCCFKFSPQSQFFPQERFLCVWCFPLVMQVCYAYPKFVVVAIFCYLTFCGFCISVFVMLVTFVLP